MLRRNLLSWIATTPFAPLFVPRSPPLVKLAKTTYADDGTLIGLNVPAGNDVRMGVPPGEFTGTIVAPKEATKEQIKAALQHALDKHRPMMLLPQPAVDHTVVLQRIEQLLRKVSHAMGVPVTAPIEELLVTPERKYEDTVTVSGEIAAKLAKGPATLGELMAKPIIYVDRVWFNRLGSFVTPDDPRLTAAEREDALETLRTARTMLRPQELPSGIAQPQAVAGCVQVEAKAEESRLAEGWHKGPLPFNTWGYGGIVLKPNVDPEGWPTGGFYFADFYGDHVYVNIDKKEREKIEAKNVLF